MVPCLGVLTKTRKFARILLRGRHRTPVPQHASLPKFYLVCCLGLLSGHHRAPLAGRLRQQKFISPSLGGWMSEIKVLMRTLLRACRQPLPSVSSHGGERVKISGVPSYKDINPITRAPPSRSHLNPITSQRPPPPQRPSHWEVGLQFMTFVGTQFSPPHQQVFKICKCPRLELGSEGQTHISALSAHETTSLSGPGPASSTALSYC